MFLRNLPHWLPFLNAWDLVGVFAYTLTFALLESAVTLFVSVLLGAVLPARFLRDRFAELGSVLVLFTLGWLVVDRLGIINSGNSLWLSVYLISIGMSYVLVYRYKRIKQLFNSLAERLSVLLYVYVPISFLSVIVVILRNI
jgi:hypothetical protein